MKKVSLFFIVTLVVIACNPVVSDKNKSGQGTSGVYAYAQAENVDFNSWFSSKTMRLDFYHNGNLKEEHFGVDQVLSDGNWPGSRTQLIDRLALGPYFFEVKDAKSEKVLFSRGFASIFGEWQTTPEADSLWGTFHESVRFPWPLEPVVVTLHKRNEQNLFKAVWSTFINPSSLQVVQAELSTHPGVDVLMENGPANSKIDLVILGDGYTQAEMGKLRADAQRLTKSLFEKAPFLNRKHDFNVRLVKTPSLSSGVTKPHHGVYVRSKLSVKYSTFGSERYALSTDNRTIRDAASAVPYDFMIILINEKTYGGGGIYNLYTTVSVDNKYSDYIMIHELGHHMAALADEYYTSSVAYEVPEIKVEPWETNITALLDKDTLKWKDLVESGTPLPTPWGKAEFDKFGYSIQKTRDSIRGARLPESKMEELFDKQISREDEYFAAEKYRGKVGAFEGAGYCQNGLYRSQLDCIMFTRHLQFCKVCSRSLEQVFDLYVK